MTFPGNPTLESAPYGPQPVLPLTGPQGGPYDPPGPKAITLLPSASRTATITTALQANTGYRGVLIVLTTSANPGGAQTLQVSIAVTDPISGQVYIILTGVATANGNGVYLVYPGATPGTVEGIALARSLPLPTNWYVGVTHSGAGAWTYSLTAVLLP